jgi:hypothetical protein
VVVRVEGVYNLATGWIALSFLLQPSHHFVSHQHEFKTPTRPSIPKLSYFSYSLTHTQPFLLLAWPLPTNHESCDVVVTISATFHTRSLTTRLIGPMRLEEELANRAPTTRTTHNRPDHMHVASEHHTPTP